MTPEQITAMHQAHITAAIIGAVFTVALWVLVMWLDPPSGGFD
jgi:hypothetical protein